MNDSSVNRQRTLAPSYSVPNDKIVALEHPCIIQNLERGLASLGSQQRLEEFLDEPNVEKRTIMVKLKPEDRFSRGIPSTRVPSSSLVLKVSVPKRTGRKRKRGSEDPFVLDPAAQEDNPRPPDANHVWKGLRDNPEAYSIQVVGSLPELHVCRSLPDLQYSTASNELMQNIRTNLLSNDFEKVKAFKLGSSKGIATQEIQPPPSMSVSRIPLPYGYRQNQSVKFVRENGLVKAYNASVVPKSITHVISFDSPTVPSESPVELPPEDTLEPRIRRCIGILRQALITRPLLSRRVQLAIVTPGTDDQLKRVWAYLGYMFRSGPFKDVLIAFGVDPRSDPKYRIYQSVTIQVSNTRERKKHRYGEPPPEPTDSQPQTYVFDGLGVHLDGRVWQVCDVTDPQLKAYMESVSISDEFDPITSGWYHNGTWSLFRSIIKDKIVSIVQGKPKGDSFYTSMLHTWPDYLDKSTHQIALPPKDASPATQHIMAIARSRAFQATKLKKDERIRQLKLKGLYRENVEPEAEEAEAGAEDTNLGEGSDYFDDEGEMNSGEDEGQNDSEQDLDEGFEEVE